MGIRKKIMIGFLSLAALLFFAGMVSLVELLRLSKTTQILLDSSTRNIELSRQMLDAVQDQNTALLQMVVLGRNEFDSLYLSGKQKFDHALAQATVTVKDLSELDSVYNARMRYNEVVSAQLGTYRKDDMDWFVNIYKTSYYELTTAIKNYMISSQSSLGTRASQLEGNAYRATSPGIITLGVAILIVLMFFFLIDLYYIRPVLKITKGLEDYLSLKIPFNVKMEGKDEVFKLKELIESLILVVKNKKAE
ncbi:CHASE3 domain-containing protein [Gallalistipes aquisgranensis]|uniref:CHASE3 domain-containing protein n=1 Tax=Gallalistipes aquisgranensis TaxID=2779358 RepID=UPI001CF8B78F|nr:hypothetical protein [Gallalistipes aquisgranensis]MBE5033019.1 hypothetical protein [Gallalistipes aquisgranensis]